MEEIIISEELGDNQGYFVTDTAGQKIEVCFETLAEDDVPTLNESDWRGARFWEVWKTLAEHKTALKLTLCDEKTQILGLVQIGQVLPAAGEAKALHHSLLEAAPVFRFGATERKYRGIGRVLVARLVAESKAQGAEGRLLIQPVPTSLPFYRTLGFVAARNPRWLRLSKWEAEQLLAACTSPPLECEKQSNEEKQ